MIFSHLSLQNFRSYSKSTFQFSPYTTYIIGPNTSGKTNIIEALYSLSTGKSFRAEKDTELLQFGQDIARVKGKTDDVELEIVLSSGVLVGKEHLLKKYLVNGVPKRRVDFAGNMTSVLFSPEDVGLVSGSPGKRRQFLDEVLEQVDREYRLALVQYERGVRQRNALLSLAKETGRRNEPQFNYWDELVIKNGAVITAKRKGFIDYLNASNKEVFIFEAIYDHSIISEARLLQYRDAEIGAGVTLVGPHRDDLHFFMEKDGKREVKTFASRGQQRLVVLQLKLLQKAFITESLGIQPLLLLDDIFSELDKEHIDLVLTMVGKQQIVITTTHEEFIDKKMLNNACVIELSK